MSFEEYIKEKLQKHSIAGSNVKVLNHDQRRGAMIAKGYFKEELESLQKKYTVLSEKLKLAMTYVKQSHSCWDQDPCEACFLEMQVQEIDDA